MDENLKKYYNHFMTILLIVFFVLLIHIYAQSNELHTLNKQIVEKEIEVNQLRSHVKNLEEDLFDNNVTLMRLREGYSILESNYSLLDKEYSDLKGETEDIIWRIEQYKKEIQSSLEWYKKNSFLDNSEEQTRVKNKIDLNCYQVRDENCYIKLGCFYLINYEKMGLDYRYDEDTFDRADKLSSISEFLKNGGGDCEDYSLFFKAEYNYAKTKCGDKNVILDGWKYPEEGDAIYTHWLNFQRSWFLEDVTKVEIEDYVFPNIVCGNIYDPILGEISGHCLIAFSNKKIETLSDIDSLDKSYIVEPQDGSFQGNLNRENSGIYLLDKTVWYDDAVKSWVSSVITDDDYFLFNEETLLWESYISFDRELTLKENQLLLLI